jgi:hypothetical protein
MAGTDINVDTDERFLVRLMPEGLLRGISVPNGMPELYGET